MRVITVAAFNRESTNLSQMEGFRDCGHEVLPYDIKIARQHKTPVEIGNQLLTLVDEFKPHLVWFAKGDGVDTNAVYLMNQNTHTALWYPDFTHNWDDNIVDKVQACKTIFCSRHSTVARARELGADAHFLHEGFDHRRDRPFPVEADLGVTFIGEILGTNCHFTRQKYHRSVGFSLIRSAYAEDHAKMVCRSRINLSFCEGDGVSDRFYKILAAGGFCLAEPWDRMEDDFVPGRDFETFSSEQELKEKIDYYMEHEEERKAIAKHGMHTVQQFNRTNFAQVTLNICLHYHNIKSS